MDDEGRLKGDAISDELEGVLSGGSMGGNGGISEFWVGRTALGVDVIVCLAPYLPGVMAESPFVVTREALGVVAED
jgi:hypothetical protein